MTDYYDPESGLTFRLRDPEPGLTFHLDDPPQFDRNSYFMGGNLKGPVSRPIIVVQDAGDAAAADAFSNSHRAVIVKEEPTK